MALILIYCIHIPILLAIIVLGKRFFADSQITQYYYAAVGLKMACGVGLGLLYVYYYNGGDTFSFYNQASVLTHLNWEDFMNAISEKTISSQPVRAIYFVRLVALIKWFSGADYWLLSCYFSLISFFGAFYFSDQLARWSSKLVMPAVISLLFFPSIVFWSSGLLKESLAFGSFTYLCGLYLYWVRHKNISLTHGILGVGCTLFLMIIKYYIAALLLPLLTYLAIFHWSSGKFPQYVNLWIKSIVIAFVLVVPCLLFLSWLSPNLTYEWIAEVIQKNHDAFIRLSPDNTIQSLNGFGQPWDTLINILYYLFSGLFRPLLFENMSFPAVGSGVENLILCFLFLWSMVVSFKHKPNWTPELLASLFYVITLSVLLAYATPNFGTLARFKIYYMPVFLIIILSPLFNLKYFSKR